MAITYPRTLLCGVRTRDFDLARAEVHTFLYDGRIDTLERAEPRWKATFTYSPFKREKHQELESWLDTVSGNTRSFLAYDPLKPYPINYKNWTGLVRVGGGAFDGTANVTSFPSVKSMALDAMPAGFVMKPGDMIGLTEGAKYGLFRVSELATATVGGLMTILFEPHMVAGHFTAAATAQFYKPKARMIVDVRTPTTRTAGERGIVTFTGIQVLY